MISWVMVAWNWFQLRHAIGGVVPKPLSIAVHNDASEQSATTNTSIRVIWSSWRRNDKPGIDRSRLRIARIFYFASYSNNMLKVRLDVDVHIRAALRPAFLRPCDQHSTRPGDPQRQHCRSQQRAILYDVFTSTGCMRGHGRGGGKGLGFGTGAWA
jgi:hypothetical protein